jgi:glycosyltransferase involved in cell wall biosynthesis
MIMSPGTPGRILMTADTIGGVWTYAMELARALGEEGVEVILASMGELATSEQRREAGAIGNLELVESRYRLPWMDHPWEDVRLAGDWLLDLAARTTPDLIHLNEPVHGSLSWPAPTLAVAHSCVVSWWEAVWGTVPPADWSRYWKEMGRGLRGADQVVAPSRWMLDAVRRFYGIRCGVIVPNGRRATDLGPERKEPLVFAAGRLWDPAKNLLLLEEVADGLPWPIYIAGEPRHPGRQEPVDAQRVHLLGQLSPLDVARWLERASIYAFPARYEPFGLSVLEAALAGCALVLGDLPTLRELWDGAAVFVSPDRPHDFRLALEGMIEEPLLRQALAMRARRRALQYTPSRMARGYLHVYADLLSGQGRYQRESVCAS